MKPKYAARDKQHLLLILVREKKNMRIQAVFRFFTLYFQPEAVADYIFLTPKHTYFIMQYAIMHYGITK